MAASRPAFDPIWRNRRSRSNLKSYVLRSSIRMIETIRSDFADAMQNHQNGGGQAWAQGSIFHFVNVHDDFTFSTQQVSCYETESSLKE